MKVIEDGMGFLEKLQAQLTSLIQPALSAISQGFTDVLNNDIMPFVEKLKGAFTVLFSKDGTDLLRVRYGKVYKKKVVF